MSYQTSYGALVWRIEYKPPGGVWTFLARESVAPTGATTFSKTYYAPTGAQGVWSIRAVLESAGSIVGVSGVGLQLTGNDYIVGKTTSRYKRSYYVSLPSPGPWDIRVTRNTPDSTASSLRNETWWDSLAEIVESKLSYPNSALVGIQLDAEQFSNIPTRGYEIYGILCQIPSNYNPITRAYSGVWDGKFVTAWTNNPAWVYYDLLSNARYGLGSLINISRIDKWSLYEIAQYCDQMVPSGYGYLEPRFSCNCYIQTREDAYKLLTSMTSIFRGMAYWSAGQVTAVADMPSDPVALFSNANIIDGEFSYSGSSRSVRHTIALVTWNDPSDLYRQKVEYVDDIEGIKQYGVNQTEVVAFACTSRGQAHRYGKHILYTERLESEVVSWKTGLEGTSVYPGAIVKVADNLRSGDRIGGRALDATINTLTLDSSITLAPSIAYTLYVALPDGSVVGRKVTSAAGITTTLTVTPDFPAIPQIHAMWVIASENLTPQTFRILSVAESGKTQVEITALQHDANKFAMIEYDRKFVAAKTSSLKSDAPSAPTTLTATDTLFPQGPGIVGTKCHLSWVSDAPRFVIKWRQKQDNFRLVESTSNSVDIAPVVEGSISFQVQGVDTLGRKSPWSTLDYTVVGKSALPSDVPYLLINGDVLTWGAVPDLDLDGYQLRWQTGNSRSWGDAQPMHEGLIKGNSHTMTVRPRGAVTIMVKAIDTSKNASKFPAYVITDLGDAVVTNVIVTKDYHAEKFPGVVAGATIDNETGDLVADIDSIPSMWSSDKSAMWVVDEQTPQWTDYTYSEMSYTDSFTVIDANGKGAQIVLTVASESAHLKYRKVDVAFIWDNAAGTMWDDDSASFWKSESWLNWPGSIPADKITYEFSASFPLGPLQGRLSAFRADIDVQDISEQFNDIIITNVATRLNLSYSYRRITSVHLTLQSDGGDAVTAIVVDKSTDGPMVKCLNSSGAQTSGLIDAIVQGY